MRELRHSVALIEVDRVPLAPEVLFVPRQDHLVQIIIGRDQFTFDGPRYNRVKNTLEFLVILIPGLQLLLNPKH
ncbi:MAG: hypothetical protein ACJ8D8_18115, partial [Microvirga sp.]